MQEFEYEAIGPDGRAVKGRAQADSVTGLVRGLTAEGHTVVEVRERREAMRSGFRRRLRPQGGWSWRFTSWRRCSSPASRSAMPCWRRAVAATIRLLAVLSSPSPRRSCAGRASGRRSAPAGLRSPNTFTTWWKRAS